VHEERFGGVGHVGISKFVHLGYLYSRQSLESSPY
jgi:hypothetical protein